MQRVGPLIGREIVALVRGTGDPAGIAADQGAEAIDPAGPPIIVELRQADHHIGETPFPVGHENMGDDPAEAYEAHLHAGGVAQDVGVHGQVPRAGAAAKAAASASRIGFAR